MKTDGKILVKKGLAVRSRMLVDQHDKLSTLNK